MRDRITGAYVVNAPHATVTEPVLDDTDRIIIGCLVAVGIIQMFRGMLQAEITYGDIFAIMSPFIVAGGIFSWRAWRKNHPFSMWFSEEPFDIAPPIRGTRKIKKSLKLPTGASRITIILRTKFVANGSPFNLKFVKTRFWRFGLESLLRGPVRITQISVPEWENEAEAERDIIGANTVTAQSDDFGGFTVSTRMPKQWMVGQPLWIELQMEADEPWSGYLSFKGHTDRIAFAKRHVTIRGRSNGTR